VRRWQSRRWRRRAFIAVEDLDPVRATVELNRRLPDLCTMNAAVIHDDFAIDVDHRRIVRFRFELVPFATKCEKDAFVCVGDTRSEFA
jgi:hypothetical protein